MKTSIATAHSNFFMMPHHSSALKVYSRASVLTNIETGNPCVCAYFFHVHDPCPGVTTTFEIYRPADVILCTPVATVRLLKQAFEVFSS